MEGERGKVRGKYEVMYLEKTNKQMIYIERAERKVK